MLGMWSTVTQRWKRLVSELDDEKLEQNLTSIREEVNNLRGAADRIDEMVKETIHHARVRRRKGNPGA